MRNLRAIMRWRLRRRIRWSTGNGTRSSWSSFGRILFGPTGEKDGDDSGWVHLQRAKEGRDPRCQFFFAVNHEKQGGYADWVEEAAAEYRAKRNRPTGTIYIPCDAGFSTMEQF